MRYLVASLIGLLAIHHHCCLSLACPWEEMKGLSPWSEAASWLDGLVPGENSAVVISNGQSILLDSQPPVLESLTIEEGGLLVWGNVDGITIETNYILVKGELHIGSEMCPFTKEAKIYLYGKTNSTHNIAMFGRKFIGVGENGTLEIHGKPKTSWTKLTTTVGATQDCQVIYDSQNQSFSKERAEGIHVTIWNLDGSLFDVTIFGTEHPTSAVFEQKAFAKYMQELPDNKVVGLSVYLDLGDTSKDQEWDVVYTSIEALGGTLIRQVGTKESYALVAITGASSDSHVDESHTKRPTASVDTLSAEAMLSLGEESKLTFTATSTTTPGRYPNEARFRVIPYDVAFPVLNTLADVSSWTPGDRVVVASTDFDWQQAEVKTIVQCKDCSDTQVRVKGAFEFMHFGEITYGVDERAEVGLLSRNIKVQGSIEESCYSNTAEEEVLCTRFGRDTFGGHLKVIRGHKSVHIQGAEFYHMGQTAFVGSYPFHFHMCDDVTGMWLRHNSIHESFARCVTIHGTDGLEVSNMVCYRHMGHGYFLEDSVEQNNTLHRNLGLGSMHGHHILTDKRPDWCPQNIRKSCGQLSTYWLTHGNNIVTDNVAAGSDKHGFMYTFSDVPLGPSYQRQLERGLVSNFSTRYTPITEFSGNTAHSNHDTGLNIEGIISHGRYEGDVYIPTNGMLINTPGQYSARDPPTEDGQTVETLLKRLTFYKNEEMDVWLRGGNLVVQQSSFGDSPIGFTSASNAGDSSNDVRDSIFIGETGNAGQPFLYRNRTGIYHGKHWSQVPAHQFSRSIAEHAPEDFVSGVAFYQGPMYVDNCYFDRYYNWFFNDSFQQDWGVRPVRPGGALSFHRAAGYFSEPYSGVSNLKFGYCDGVENQNYVITGNSTSRGWSEEDGSVTTSFRDYDGSVTGLPGAQVVRNRPFFTGPQCQPMPQWGMSACPYSYAAVIIIGEDGVLSESLKRQWPTLISRDDQPTDVINLQGRTTSQWTVRTNMSYTIRFNQTLGETPFKVRVKAFDLDRDEVVRLALCFPTDTTQFYITGVGPVINKRSPAVLVDSLEQLDADDTGKAYYWNSTQGLLYIKMVGQGYRDNADQSCPGDQCTVVSIARLDGGKGPVSCDVTTTPYTGLSEIPQDIGVKHCDGIDSPDGLGALTKEEIEAAPAPQNDPECPSQPSIPDRGPVEYRGCFLQMRRNLDMNYAYIKLYESMTPQVCSDRCFQRGFPYSANHYGYKCECGYSFGRTGPTSDSACGTPCKGDHSQTCGANGKYKIQTTGAPLAPSPIPCGPGGRGVSINETSCLYLSTLEEDWLYARRRCLEMGGDLAKIDSQDKQRVVEEYLLGLTYEVWAGMVWQDHQWKHLDGTPVTYDNWYSSLPTGSHTYFLRIVPRYSSMWFYHRNYDNNMALCDLPLSDPPVRMSCGYKGLGVKKGKDGRCFALVHRGLRLTNAHYTCHHMNGRLASVESETDRHLVETHLVEFGSKEDYWVHGGTGANKGFDFYGHERYILKTINSRTEMSAICHLDDTDRDAQCPSGWTRFSDSCYLSRGDSVNNLQLVSAYCNSENTQIVTIENEAENDYVISLLPGKAIWLGLQYRATHDKFVWVDGVDRTYSNWYYSNPLTHLGNGLCAFLDPKTQQWRNKKCYSGTAFVICEMPAMLS